MNMKHFLAYPSPAVYAINKARHEREKCFSAQYARSPGSLNNRSSTVGSLKAGKEAGHKTDD